MSTEPRSGLQLQSLLSANASVRVSLESAPLPELGPRDVLVRVEAAPINPSDLGLMFPGADMGNAALTGTAERPIVTAPVRQGAMATLAPRIDVAMPLGHEGAGTVIAAGTSPQAQSLLGRTVAMFGGAMYAQFRAIDAGDCLLLPEGITAQQGASSFVNPLTALGMLETMRREGHRALVHTAAASNLGQMLNRVCLIDGVGLVNVVRRPEQAAILREAGAKHVCDSSSPSFESELTDAVHATGATIAFDAVSGGRLAGQILSAMEFALNRGVKVYSRYGSLTHKQVYLYGALDPGVTEFKRDFGTAWGMGGWILTTFLQKLDPTLLESLKQRVAAGIATTFATHYSHLISLSDALTVETIASYMRKSTGDKYLIVPSMR